MTIDEILDEVEKMDRAATPPEMFRWQDERAKEAFRGHAPALAAEVRRLRAQIDEGMACGLRAPREQPRTVRTRWRVSGKIVSTLDEHEVEAIDREDAQHKAEADADNFAEWEEGPEIEEIDEDEDRNPLPDPSDEDRT